MFASGETRSDIPIHGLVHEGKNDLLCGGFFFFSYPSSSSELKCVYVLFMFCEAYMVLKNWFNLFYFKAAILVNSHICFKTGEALESETRRDLQNYVSSSETVFSPFHIFISVVCDIRMEKKNKKLSHRVKEERDILDKIKRKKSNEIGHILHRKRLLKQTI